MTRRASLPTMTTDELMARACPIIRDIGWAHYFSPEAEATAAQLGLDLFTLYALGRGGVLGDVEVPVQTVTRSCPQLASAVLGSSGTWAM